MRILSSKEARRIDRYAMTELGISGESLMGNAGLAVAEQAKNMLLKHGGMRAVIVCGKGNNGGDGYAAAVRLYRDEKNVSILSTVSVDNITGETKIFHDRCIELGLPVKYEANVDDEDLSRYDLVIDGLLGTGIKGNVRSEAANWIDKINQSNSPILAIDIPSGVCSDSGKILGKAVRAEATVTMGFLKQGLVMNPGADLAGDVIVAEIGYPDEAFHVLAWEKGLIQESLAKEYLTKPPSNTYKHRMGKTLILAGSKGFTGAGCLASEAALRVGAGLVIAGVPESINSIFEMKLTEVITAPLPDGGSGKFISDSVEHLKPHLDWSHVIAIGPGIGTEPDVLQFCRKLFKTVPKPFVIDADALTVFHNNLDLFKSIKQEFIITPHYGEAAVLFGVEKQVIVDNPFRFAHESAVSINGIIVLKGAPTLVADGETVVASTTGHQGLATGGSGDVLTGMIAGFLAQGMTAIVAAQLGVFIHGKAADVLKKSHGYRSMIAGDLLQVLPSVISIYEHN